MEKPLAGRIAWVTGASRGIGKAIAHSLAEAGALVALGMRDPTAAEPWLEALRQGGGRAEAFRLDVTGVDSIANCLGEIEARLGPVDILVNNAGIAHSAPFHQTSVDELRHVLEVNLVGTFVTTKAVLPSMIERGWGRLIQIASTAGLTGYRYTAAYAASKHAVIGLTRSLALEVADKGITANAVCPGWTATDMLEDSAARIAEATGRSHDDARSRLARMNPLGRVLQPEEIARMVVFLADPASSGITGQTFNVDGGEVLT